jgi:hypothetical protein
MATTPGGTRRTGDVARGERFSRPGPARRGGPAGIGAETKHSTRSSEFYAYLAATAAVLIAGAVSDSFDGSQIWWIVGTLTAAYMISRGLAKAGNSEPSRAGREPIWEDADAETGARR